MDVIGAYNKTIPVKAGAYTWAVDFHLMNNDDNKTCRKS
jgi:hypothetical protein